MSPHKIVILKIIELACVVGGLVCGMRAALYHFYGSLEPEMMRTVLVPYLIIPICAAVSLYARRMIETITELLYAEAEDEEE